MKIRLIIWTLSSLFLLTEGKCQDFEILVGESSGHEPQDTVYSFFKVEGFEDILSMQFSVVWNDDFVDFLEVSNFGLGDLGPANYSIHAEKTDGMDTVHFSWNSSIAEGTSLVDGSVVFAFSYTLKSSITTDDVTTLSISEEGELLDVEVIKFSNGDFVEINYEPQEIGRITLDPSGGITPIILSTDHIVTSPDTDIEFNVFASEFQDVASVQFSLNWDPEVMEFESLGSLFLSQLSSSNFSSGSAEIEEGKLRFSWNDASLEGVTLNGNAILFSLIFRTVTGNGFSSQLEFSDDPIKIEAFNSEVSSLPVETLAGSLTIVGNSRPKIVEPIGDRMFDEAFSIATIDISQVFEDPDDDDLTLEVEVIDESVVTASIDGTLLTLMEGSRGITEVEITATDENGGTIEESFTVQVGELNIPPDVISPIPNQVVTEGFSSLRLDLSNVFLDDDGDDLTYTSAVDDPTVVTAAIVADELTLTEVGFGSTEITVFADDGINAQTPMTFSLATNRNPIVGKPIADLMLVEGFSVHSFGVSQVFEDPDDDILTLEVNVVDESVISASFDGFTLNLTEISLGSTVVELTANDGIGGMAQESFTVEVVELNVPPDVTSPIADQAVTENFSSLTFDLNDVFTDDDGDNLTFTSSVDDPNVVTSEIMANELVINEEGFGTTQITVFADDGVNSLTSTTFSISINRHPTIGISLPDLNLKEGFSTRDIDVSQVFEDPDSDALVLGVDVTNESVVTASIEGFDLTLMEVSTGQTVVTITALDGKGGMVEESFTVRVQEEDPPPPPPLGVADEDQITVYPTFSTRYFQLEFNQIEKGEIEIHGINGQKVKFRSMKSGTQNILDLEGNPPGLYIVRIRSGDQIVVGRLVKL